MTDTATHLASVGDTTLEYLDQRATESFKRQLDLEESIWRSLPFFTAALIAASAMLAHAAAGLPPIALRPYPIIGNILLVLSALAFGASFLWLWGVPWPRDSEYPARDDEVAAYAAKMTAYHSDAGLVGDALDAATLRELRVYMATIFGEAAQSHFTNNQARLSARSQALLFMLYGFVLAFACDATTFLPKIMHQAQPSGAINVHAANQDAAAFRVHTANSAPSQDRARRSLDHQDERRPSNPEQVSVERDQAPARGRPSDRNGAAHGAPGAPAEADDDQDRIGRGAGARVSASAGPKKK